MPLSISATAGTNLRGLSMQNKHGHRGRVRRRVRGQTGEPHNKCREEGTDGEGSKPATQVQDPTGTIHSPSPLQYSFRGTDTSIALVTQAPGAITKDVASAPVAVSGKTAKLAIVVEHFLKKTLTEMRDMQAPRSWNARDVGDAGTVADGELELHVDAQHALAGDEVRPEPVVLVGLSDIAHLVFDIPGCTGSDTLRPFPSSDFTDMEHLSAAARPSRG
ncbi:hypothetical protein EYF80_035430 [Liparis tanakae]|uniref:Uncharacterized protein n=1 Tax=Liparis tanakae TaxID=230148 RepID=A0A4Z2GMA2_9TELE|nr:hypothetical protein EYF80_035430 [Liparis tanakae]